MHGAHRRRPRLVVLPDDCCSTIADRYKTASNDALQNISVVAKTDAVIPALP